MLHDATSGAMLAINLADETATIDLGPQDVQDGEPIEVFADHDYPLSAPISSDIELGPYGYRWIRLRRTIGARAGSSSSTDATAARDWAAVRPGRRCAGQLRAKVSAALLSNS